MQRFTPYRRLTPYRAAMMGLRALAVLAAMAAGTAVAASTTTYRWVDAQGVVHYSDTPQPGAEQLQLSPAQTYRAPPTVHGPQPSTAPVSNEPANPYQTCAITQPATNESLFAPDSVRVRMQLSPTLRAGDQLAVMLDGTPLQPSAPGALDFQVTQIDRGAHTVTAAVRDAGGKMVCSATAVTFYVQQPSLLAPNSPARAH